MKNRNSMRTTNKPSRVSERKRPVVLVVENDKHHNSEICEMLRDRRLEPSPAKSESEARNMLRLHADDMVVALIDIRIPKTAASKAHSASERTLGLQLARYIRERHPHIRLIGMSFFAEENVREWFAEYGYGYLRKSWLVHGAARDFIDVVEQAASKPHRKRKPKCFIVHGHDGTALHETILFIRDNLGWPRPLILRELPSQGRTIIEKFEETAEAVDLVFVLLTPDDSAVSSDASNALKRRARQNVIFEMGYFFSKLQRIGGRIILLHKGVVELPSDISGIVYVDISDGIEAAGEILRKELSPWL